CLKAGIPFDGIYTDDSVPVQEEGTSRRFSVGDVRAAWATPRLVRYMRRVRPKAVIVKSGQLGPATVLAGWITGTPVIPWETTITDLEVDSVGPRMKAMFKVQKLFYRKAAALAGASRDVADWASRSRRVPPSRVFVWPNAFDLERIRKEGGENGPPPAPPIRMIAIGRLVEQKAYDVMIEALAIANPDLPDWHLEILGVEGVWKGNWKARIEERVARHGLGDKISLAGHLENPYEGVRRSHLFLHSARWEAFGNVIVEALALGTPVVLCDCPGAPKEILEGGRFGRLVPNEDSEAFAEAVVELAGDPEERKRLSTVGFERAEDYSVDRLLPMILSDIERVTGVSFSRSASDA
ncbi:MAG: glycosyltransferase, partial [Solirubrobacterales bacterium]